MKYLVFTLFIFSLLFGITNAQVVINEVQISPIDERFIELYNIGDSDIDLTGWYIQRKIATKEDFDSLVTGPNFKNKTIKAGGYFLISRSSIVNTDIVLDKMTLTEFNTLRLKDSKKEVVEDIAWEKINEGESYQRISFSKWIVASPTPGTQNKSSGSGEESTQEEDGSKQQSSSNITPANDFPTEPQIFASAGGDRNVIIGADSLFEGRALGLQKKPLEGARYLWNFGNGETKEGQNILYHYQYPEKYEYVVTLNVSSGQYSATDRIIVNAYPAEIVISKVENNFIEIHNKSNQELNLSWWQLESQGKRFMIPKDTIVLPNKKLIFAKNITELNTDIKDGVSLLYPNGVSAVAYFQMKISQKVLATKEVAGEGLSSGKSIFKEERSDGEKFDLDGGGSLRSVTNSKEEEVNIKETVSVKTAQAAAVLGFKNSKNENNIYKWLLAIFTVVGISVGIIVYASGKRELGDDIEIIE